MPQVARSTTRLGSLLLAMGVAPFAVGAAAGAVDAPRVCPFSMATGVPCPLCGTTRSFSLAAAGDPSFLQFNAVWVGVAAVVALAGAALLLLRATGRLQPPAVPWARLWPVALAVVAVAWAWALAHRDVIVA
jgi:cytochrome bd-type quinol oxidase subunit 2